MRKAAIIVNYRKQACLDLADELADELRRAGVALIAPQGAIAFTVNDIVRADLNGVEMVFVLGGDGTLLTAGRAVAFSGAPLLGVNMGHVGFLSELEPKELLPSLPALIEGRYSIEERMMLSCRLLREDKEVDSCIAFNDVVINNGRYARTVNIDLCVDGQDIHSYHADGIIIATPTGSTGYSFSAGGPVVMPDMDVIVIVPICPHTFFSRPIVTSPQSTVEVVCRSSNDAIGLSADGQYRGDIVLGDTVRISVSDRKVKMARLAAKSPFAQLKKKIYQT